jgi:hypothetical protein
MQKFDFERNVQAQYLNKVDNPILCTRLHISAMSYVSTSSTTQFLARLFIIIQNGVFEFKPKFLDLGEENSNDGTEYEKY